MLLMYYNNKIKLKNKYILNNFLYYIFFLNK